MKGYYQENMNYYNEIKKELINNETYKRVKDYSKNRSDLTAYYNVGKLLIEAQGGEERAKYGDGIIKEYSKRLTEELGNGYSTRSLKNMRKFYVIFRKGQAPPAQLTWSHYCELLPINDINEINYYIKVSLEQNLSYRKLHDKIKSKEYERLSEKAKNKLLKEEHINIKDLVPNPILIKTKDNVEVISEKILHQLILEDITLFMKELGRAYSFVDSEYKIKIGNNYNYIDLLLYNIEFNCYVVVELKVTELKKEHIGQIEVYMNYIDNNLKKFNQDKTIGIIICKKDNKFIMEYCSDERILSREYELL